MLGAAVADDVLGLIILTVVVKVVTGRRGDGRRRRLDRAHRARRSSSLAGAVRRPRRAPHPQRRPPLLAVGHDAHRRRPRVVLGLAVLADAAQLAFIIGAFMAGLAIGRSDHHERIAGDLNSVGGVFIPVFFVLIGVNADLGAMLRPSVLLDAVVLLVIAVAGKIVSATARSGTAADRLLVGFGMIPRGEVGLIFASIGLAQGVLDDELYGALLLVVLLTTVVTPPLLRWRIGCHRAGRRRRRSTRRRRAEPDGRVGRRCATARSCSTGRPPSSSDRRRRPPGRRPGRQRPAQRDAAPVVRRPARRRRSRGPATTPTRCSTCCAAATRAPCACSTSPACSSGACRRRRGRRPAPRRPERARSGTGAAVPDRRPSSRSCSSTRVDGSRCVGAGDGHRPRRPGDRCRRPRRRHPATSAACSTSCRRRSRAVEHVLGVGPPAAGRRRRPRRLRRGRAAPARHPHRLRRRRRERAYLARRRQLAGRPPPGAARPAARPRRPTCSPTPNCSASEADSLADGRGGPRRALVDEPGAVTRAPWRARQLPADPRARRARPPGPARRAAARRAARSASPSARRARPTTGSSTSPAATADGLLARLARALTAAGCDIAAATVATWPDGAVVDTFLVRSAVRPGARPLAEQMEAGAPTTPRRGAVEPTSSVQFDNDALPVAHGVHGHRAGPSRHARRARRRLRRRPASSCTAPA